MCLLRFSGHAISTQEEIKKKPMMITENGASRQYLVQNGHFLWPPSWAFTNNLSREWKLWISIIRMTNHFPYCLVILLLLQKKKRLKTLHHKLSKLLLTSSFVSMFDSGFDSKSFHKNNLTLNIWAYRPANWSESSPTKAKHSLTTDLIRNFQPLSKVCFRI